MICQNCGSQLTEGMRFCNACGAPVQPAQPAGLRYEVFGGNLPAVSIKLDAGQSIYTSRAVCSGLQAE